MYAAGITSHARVATNIPNSYKQAVHGPKVAFWQKGINKELASHRKNRTWAHVPRIDATNILTSRWVFNVKQLRCSYDIYSSETPSVLSKGPCSRSEMTSTEQVGRWNSSPKFSRNISFEPLVRQNFCSAEICCKHYNHLIIAVTESTTFP